MRRPHRLASLLVPSLSIASLTATPAHAAPACRAVEADFTVAASGLQLAIWIEDASGKYVDTAFVTRLVGQFGLGNRPGSALLKTNFGWPYGRREMTMPVWAHRRNHHYPLVVMGGECGTHEVNSTSSICSGTSPCGGDCDDTTIAYHSLVSSFEPFYCSPSGPSSIDAMSCASKGTFSKGAFGSDASGSFSLYPPRADLSPTSFQPTDSTDAHSFASLDDIVAVSGATPLPTQGSQVTWFPPSGTPDGQYVLWLEVSQESDFNASHNHPNIDDSVGAWNFEGHPFLGQPSVLYQVPFTIDGDGFHASSTSYAGYGAWDGQDGALRSPDATITTTQPGSGAARLLADGSGARLSVTVGGCGATVPGDMGVPALVDGGGADGSTMVARDGGTASDLAMTPPACAAPAPVTNLVLTPQANSLGLTWSEPTSGTAPAQYQLRYNASGTAITDVTFTSALASSQPPPSPSGPGAVLSTTLTGLMPSTRYTVAVRGVSACNQAAPVVSQTTTTASPQFATLQGCFVATAAWGDADDDSVRTLRRMRDHHLLDNAAGRLFVATYYAVSPSLANAIAGDARLRTGARALLAPLVTLARALP